MKCQLPCCSDGHVDFQACPLKKSFLIKNFRALLNHGCASLSLCSAADMRVVSRNCTEDGWSEPFPHYFDACGFDEYESETGDQVSVWPA